MGFCAIRANRNVYESFGRTMIKYNKFWRWTNFVEYQLPNPYMRQSHKADQLDLQLGQFSTDQRMLKFILHVDVIAMLDRSDDNTENQRL